MFELWGMVSGGVAVQSVGPTMSKLAHRHQGAVGGHFGNPSPTFVDTRTA